MASTFATHAMWCLAVPFWICLFGGCSHSPGMPNGGIEISKCFEDSQFRPIPTVVNVGAMPSGQRVSKQLRITNSGNEIIVISSVAASCDCVLVDLPAMQLASGASMDIQVTIDLSKEPTFTGTLCPTIVLELANGPARVIELELDVHSSSAKIHSNAGMSWLRFGGHCDDDMAAERANGPI